jgi:ATP-dependent helicase/nuclease subunit A
MTKFEYKNILYKAGAGAGKTTELTRFITESALEFKKQNGRFPKLVVTTFTRKATQELKERLMARAIESEDFELTQYFSSSNQVFISTMHGVLSLFLNRFGFRMGLDPALQILGESDLHRLRRRTLKRLFGEHPKFVELLDFFSMNQLLLSLESYHREKSMHPDMQGFGLQDLAEAFEVKLAGLSRSLFEIVDQIQEETSQPSWIEYAGWLKEVAAGLGKNWNRSDFLESFKSKRKPPQSKTSPAVSEELNEWVSFTIDQVKELGSEKYNPQFWQSYEKVGALYQELADLYRPLFEMSKKNLGGISTDDLELLALRCAGQFPEVAESFSKEWDYWLIDEYQDTSPIQERIIDSLKGASRHFVVGDPQQSIYLFRGARAELFHSKQEAFEKVGDEIRHLTTNYRSDPELVHFFNDFFSKIGKSFTFMNPKSLESDADSNGMDECKIQFLMAESRESEVESIAHQIRRWLANGVQAEDICILAKTNETLREIAKGLYLKKIPCHLHSSSGFSKRREVVDAISLLQFLINPDDNFNLLRLLRSPFCRVGDQQLVNLVQNLKSRESLWSMLSGGADVTSDSELSQTKRNLQMALQDTNLLGVGRAFETHLVHFGYLDFSEDYDPTGRRESNLWKLLKRMSDAESDPGFTYHNFVTQILSSGFFEDDGDATPALEPRRVNLMTIHHSKGLQFPHVIVPQMDKKSRPFSVPGFVFCEKQKRWSLSLPSGPDNKREALFVADPIIDEWKLREKKEQERVLYVALTRAAKSVMLSWSGEPQASSLAQLVACNLEEGVHQESGYKYIVVKSISDIMTFVPLEKQTSVTRSKLETAVAGEGLRVSVTHLLKPFGAKTDQQTKSTSPQASEPKWKMQKLLESAERGVAIHRLLETLKYEQEVLDKRLLDQHVFHILGEKSPSTLRSMTEILKFVLEQREVPVSDLIKNGFVEWGFLLKHSGALIEGQIDLWGEHSGVFWVVDYKSGSSEGVEKAFEQLGIYSYALRQSHQELRENKKPLNMAVIFPGEKKVFVKPAPHLEETRAYLDEALKGYS